jgi:hypothetical protein
MSSTSWRGCELIGSQVPRVWSAPSAVTSAGPEALALAETAGMEPMPWQRFVCERGLRENADGSWAAMALLLLIPRQNGKGTIIEIVELYCLFQLGQNVYHTAHLFATSKKAFKRLWALIRRTPSLLRRVAGKPNITADQITITLTSGAFISFVARSTRMGRGFDDVDVLVLDEALFLDASVTEASVSAMTTRPKPLIIYASSAGVVGSKQLRGLRKRMVDGDPTMAGFEWSVDPDLLEREDFDPLAVEVLAQANPSLADRRPGLVTVEWCAAEAANLSRAGQLRERLGVFDEDPSEAKAVIPAGPWAARADPERRRPTEAIAFGLAAEWPDAASAAIAVAGRRDDGRLVVQVIEHRAGTAWAVKRLRELYARHAAPVVIDAGGPAGHLIEDLEEPDDPRDEVVEVLTVTAQKVGHASKELLGEITGDDASLAHLDQPELNDAVAGAGRRNLGELWTWQRRGEVEIAPLEAVTLAAHGSREVAARPVPMAAWS